MCNMSGYVENRAKVDVARNFLDETQFTLEQILDIMKIDEYDRPWFIDQLTDYGAME